MQRPKPKILTNAASFILGRFIAAKMAIREKLSERRTEMQVNNRQARRDRMRGLRLRMRGAAGTCNPLRGYYARYSHSLTEYCTQQNLKPSAAKRERQATAKLHKATNRRNTQIMQRIRTPASLRFKGLRAAH